MRLFTTESSGDEKLVEWVGPPQSCMRDVRQLPSQKRSYVTNDETTVTFVLVYIYFGLFVRGWCRPRPLSAMRDGRARVEGGAGEGGAGGRSLPSLWGHLARVVCDWHLRVVRTASSANMVLELATLCCALAREIRSVASTTKANAKQSVELADRGARIADMVRRIRTLASGMPLPSLPRAQGGSRAI